MTTTISIIIPVYNTEKYLRKCLDSILAQTLSDFECILIDDGSRDDSPAICDEYAQKDERIKVIHQKNSGASAARNAGLDIAHGEWITFVDSDDWINKNYLELMYNNAINNNCELSICGMRMFGENGKLFDKYKQIPLVHFDKNSAKNALLGSKYFSVAISGKLVMRKYICEYGICFDVGIKVGEDALFWFEVIDKVDNILYDSTPCYNYKRNSMSVTLSGDFYINYMDVFKVTKKIHSMEENNIILRNIRSLEVFYSILASYTMAMKNIANREYYHFYFSVIRKNILSYLLNSYVPIKYKILAILTLCPFCYKCAVRIRQYVNIFPIKRK
ncbi:MAG: glycosyltransferase [Chitinispirillia bacterium]|nr:glycosyltransferase [Chitinispirillia bacterium]